MDGDTISAGGGTFDRALPDLRFVLRDGKRILQQAWHVDSVIKDWPQIEWRDVPLVEESK